jgi:GT2 family glycosyltransferase
MSTATNVSVIIVNYNAGALLEQSVGSALDDASVTGVIVSDNGSSDDSIAAIEAHFGDEPRLTVIENHANLGFSRGNNLALPHADGDYLLFLNPDCLLQPGTLAGVLEFMQAHPKVGMAGCRIDNPDGTEQASGRRTLPTPFSSFARFSYLDKLPERWRPAQTVDLGSQTLPDGPIEVEAISGAFMLVRREALEQVGPLDEDYFLHCEDLDWFMRFRLADWAIWFVPDYAVIHYKGRCSRRHPVRVLWHKHHGMVRFFRKFQFQDYPKPLAWLVVAAVWTRFALAAAITWVRGLLRREA